MAESLNRSQLRDRDVSGSSLADFSPEKIDQDSSGCPVDLSDCFNLLGGENKFWSKLAIYLRTITGSNLRYGFESLDVNEDGEIFITVEVREPTHYRKGVKLSDLLDFFGLNLPDRYRPSGGGGGGVKSERSEDGERLRRSAPGISGGGGGG